MPLSSPGLPVTLVLGGRSCLVVGGGAVAARKARTLLAAEAVVTMVAPAFGAAAEALAVRRERREYHPGEAGAYHLVVAATGIPEVDGAVFADADAAQVLVNAADDPDHCSFILPAVHRAGAVSVAVSTDGRSPALASWLRDRIGAGMGDEVASLAEHLGSARQALRAAGASTEGRDWRGLIEALSSSAHPDELARAWVERQLGSPARS